MLRSLPLALALALAAPAAAQTTWYVDVQGTPPGTGTPGNPYTSLQYAIDQASTVDGDTLLVAPGLYLEEVAYQGKHLIVRSTGGPLVTTIQAPPGSSGFTVTLDHVTGPVVPVLEGFTVAGPPGGGTYGVQLINGAILRGCVMRGHRASGGLGTGGYGVQGFLYGSVVERCTIVDNDVGAIDHGHFGDLLVYNSVVDGNDVDLNQIGAGLAASWSAWSTHSGNVSGGNNLVPGAGMWNPSQGDPNLAPGSPCIDTGDPQLPPDPDGSPPDRGAVPFDASYLPPIAVYCTSIPHSGGCAPQISTKGGLAASLSAGLPFRVEATGIVENVPGLLFYGTGGRAAVTFQSGFRCVELPLTRTAAMLSGDTGPTACRGFFSFDFNDYLQSLAGLPLQPGMMVDAQYWYRDPGDPLGFGSATTDAVEFPVGP